MESNYNGRGSQHADQVSQSVSQLLFVMWECNARSLTRASQRVVHYQSLRYVTWLLITSLRLD